RSGVADPFVTSYQGSWVTPLNPTSLTQTENYFISYFSRVSINYSKKYTLKLVEDEMDSQVSQQERSMVCLVVHQQCGLFQRKILSKTH
ncbi:MAG TPA: hypothetical protein VIK07_00910, partial [Bacteroidales bacterium]